MSQYVRSELLTLNEVAKILRVSTKWMYRHIKSGTLPIDCNRVGKSYRFNPAAVKLLAYKGYGRNKVFEEKRKSKEEADREWQESEAKIKQAREKIEEIHRNQTNINTDLLFNALNEQSKEAQKRADWKEKIRLSADGMKDPFQDALMDYLNGLADDNRRIEACYNIIKICKKIANELQSMAVKV
jgi:excisionase family DNA binding protein